MPPEERAASTGGRGIDTVLGAAPAGNAAQKRNITTALTDDEREKLIDLVDRLIRNPDAVTAKDCIIGNDVRTVQWIAEHTRALLTSPRAAADAEHRFKNFHRLLCERFDYTHDEIDWKRDQVSLIEHIAKKVAAPRAAVPAPEGWKLVPIEPTDEMVESGHAEYERALIGNRKDIGVAFLRRWAAMLDAAPAAPVAEPAPDPLRRRVERLLVELHAEGRLSEGQCVRVLDIPREDWRELAEFLSSATQAGAADGAPADKPSEVEQVIECLGDDAAKLREANPDDEMADNMEAAARMLSERVAVSPAAADELAALREMLDDARNEFTMVREALGVAYEPHQTLLERTLDAARASQAAAPAPADERPAFDAWLAAEYPDVAAAMKNEFTNPDVVESVDMARAAWDRASQSAAPADPADVVSRQVVIDWAVERWTLEVNGRPLGNIHRRSLDDAWRQLIRYVGADDVSLLGPRHDDLIAAHSLSVALPDSEGGEA